MKFIRKRNLLEGEELLYVPRLHWAYIISHMVKVLPGFMVLVILWSLFRVQTISVEEPFVLDFVLMMDYFGRQVLMAAVLVLLVDFIWRIILYLNTEYGVTNKRLIIKRGLFHIVVVEIPIDRIESIKCEQSILGGIFGYGTIFIGGIGGKTQKFLMVSQPFALRRKIAEIIEKNKTITIVHGDLPKPKPKAPKPEPVVEEEPYYRYGTFVKVLDEGQK